MESSGSWDLPDQLVRNHETEHFRDESLAPCQHLTVFTGAWMLHGPYTSTPVLAERRASHMARCTCSLRFHLDSVSIRVAPCGQKTMLLIPSADICIVSYRAIACQKPSRK